MWSAHNQERAGLRGRQRPPTVQPQSCPGLSRIKDPRPEALVNRICRLILSKDGPIPVPRAWENTTLGHKRARLQTELGLPTVRDENRKGSLDHPSGA